MSIELKLTVVNNSNTSDAKLVTVRGDMELAEFLKFCSKKLQMQPEAKTCYVRGGKVVEDVFNLVDGDVVYVSAGERYMGDVKQVSQVSIAVMGPGGVGKSAVTLQYCTGVFVNEYDPTIEDAYRKNVNIDGEPCLLDILDTAGQEDYTSLRSTWMRNRNGYLLIFSVTDRGTFAGVQPFYDQLCVVHEGDIMPPIVLVGNKADLEDKRQVTTEEGIALAKQFGDECAYIETSAKSKLNIDTAFTSLVREVWKSDAYNGVQRKEEKKGFWSFCTVL